MSFFKNDKGFTLIEIVISTAIFVMVLAGAYSMLNETLRFWQHGSENIDMQQNARIALTMIEYDIKRAQKGTVQVNPPGSTGSTLRLTVEGKIITYSLNGTQLQRAVGGEGNNPVACNVTKLEFEDIDIDGDGQPDGSLIKIYMEFSTDEVFFNLSSKAQVRATNY